ncbi:YHS domain-containing (seleno)protein [Dongia deserti]|uniref:YHS domain-containing (seleno)protein n=1 Tax=Dongia deserti TaxID=2268030 RepID=UPI000E6538B7|nr:YHS domain-containing (seleno)protein [Dongia deserti]
MRLPTLILAAALLSTGLGHVVPATTAVAAGYELNLDQAGLAIHGYDPVAYFTDGAAIEGKADITAEHNGATYRFASAEHRSQFLADPEKYLPQYGGYCAYGTSVGKKFNGDPTAWRVVDGKLYLNLSADVQRKWLEDVSGRITEANKKWLTIMDKSPESVNGQ